jgi:two-component system, LytTR family, sensor kinase
VYLYKIIKPPFMTRIKLYWTLQISCWGIYICYASLGIIYYQQNVVKILSAGLLNFLVFILSTHLYRIGVRERDIEILPLYKFLIRPIVGNIIIAIIVSIMNSSLLHFGQVFSPEKQPTFGYYTLQFLDTFRFVMPWFIFYHGIRFAERAIQNERGKVEAQMQLKVAELDNLRNQLNPHFLFNSLNSIRSLTLTDPKMAREATTKLSDLLRISLTYKDLQDIPFEEELNLVKDYLSLEKIRFENRLNYQFEISRGILKALVPPMSLQLLAENAVKHGISKSKNGGEITIFAKKKANYLIFGVKNTGTLNDSIGGKRKGIGLENLRKRLALNYGLDNGFQIFEEQGTVTSEICIPLKTN